MSHDLQKALLGVAQKQWRTFAQEPDGTQRQWAELDFVPGERGEKKQSQPARYVGLRLLKPQDRVAKTLRLTNLLPMFTVYDTEAEALRAFAED